MSDIRGGAYSRTQINKLFACNTEEQLIWDCLVDSVWAEYVIYDVFCDGTKRESPDPYTDELTLLNGDLVVNSPIANTIYGFTSKLYTNVQAADIDLIVCDFIYDNSAGGDVKFEISVDGGLNYTIIVDTALSIDLRTQEVVLSNAGNDVIVRLEITTDSSANGAILEYFSVIF